MPSLATTDSVAHTDRSFDGDLAALRAGVLEMGTAAAEMVVNAAGLLAGALLGAPDPDGVARVLAEDRRLDALRDALDERAVLVIARRQPVAVDLRAIVAVMRIAGALERVGDLAKNIAKRSAAVAGAEAPPGAVASLRRMAERARLALDRSVAAYGALDHDAAAAVWHEDAELDAMLGSLFRELLTHMAEQPRSISACTQLLFCAKNLERIGDHATTIAEAVTYIVTGASFEGERPKLDSVAPLAD